MLDQGLEVLARDEGLLYLQQRASWFGLDPIHLRQSKRDQAWAELLGRLVIGEPVAQATTAARIGPGRLRRPFLAPERRWWLGFWEQRRLQPAWEGQGSRGQPMRLSLY